MRHIHRLFATVILSLFMVMPGYADVESARQLVAEIKPYINDDTDASIALLYKKLTEALTEYEQTDDAADNPDAKKQGRIDELEAKAQKAREKEQSLKNRLLGAAGMGSVGIGGMQAMSAMAEQSADDAAEQDMRAYLATFRCDYGRGRNIVGGETGIQLPGANELSDYVTEYKELALRLQADKAALGMAPGLESELVLDSATMNLYNNASIGRQKGTFTSLSRALLDENSSDAAEWDEQRQNTRKKRQVGTLLAAGGAVSTLAVNLGINEINKKSDDSTSNTDEQYIIYEQDMYIDMDTLERIDVLTNDLNEMITENERMMTEYNDELILHQNLVKEITMSSCKETLKDYIDYINGLKPISNKYQSVYEIIYELSTAQQKYDECNQAIQTGDDITAEKAGPMWGHKENRIDKFAWMNVNMMQAVRIAKEYLRAQGIKVEYCDDEWDTIGNDDFFSCTTTQNKVYTFVFDDVTETIGNTIRKDTAKAICQHVYGGKPRPISPIKAGTETIKIDGIGCEFDMSDASPKCESMKNILKDFDFLTYVTNDKKRCNIYFTPYTRMKQINKVNIRVPSYGKREYVLNNSYDGIDNFYFRKKGFQVRGDVAVGRLIEHWLSMKTGVENKNIRCNDGTTVYYGDDAVSGVDDILGCFINGKRVDLVFDDFSENWNNHTKKFLQAGICYANNAEYTGNSCIGESQQMTKEQCNKLAHDLQQYCPACESPIWENNVCKTRENAALATFIDEAGPQIGLVLASVVFSIPTGGASVVAWVGFTLSMVGAVGSGLSYRVDYYMASEVQNFIDNVSSQCHANPCMINGQQTQVVDLLKEYLTRMLNLNESIDSVHQKDALKGELVRLLKLLPRNGQSTEFQIALSKGGSTKAEDIQKVKRMISFVTTTATVAGMGLAITSPGDYAVVDLLSITVDGVGLVR